LLLPNLNKGIVLMIFLMHALRESMNNALNRQDAEVAKKKDGYQGGKLGVLGVLAVQNQL